MNKNLIRVIDQEGLKTDVPSFKPGDTVQIHVRIKEGDKFRIQVFEGVVIAIRRAGPSSTFTVRKISFGYGVERIFPLYSPVIDKMTLVKSGKVRRAKLYYLRGRKGKAARLKEVRAKMASGSQGGPSQETETVEQPTEQG